MFLLVGLGNPGKEYAATRHNIGFMAIDEIADSYGFKSATAKFHGLLQTGQIVGNKVVTLKPTTFMNRSGVAVSEAAKFYKIPLQNIIVIHDEIDLDLGRIRVKSGGGAGGHNGLRDIDSRIGKDYKRVRVGVGHPGDKDRVSSYVLSKFAKSEVDEVQRIVISVADNIDILVKGDESLFMTRVV